MFCVAPIHPRGMCLFRYRTVTILSSRSININIPRLPATDSILDRIRLSACSMHLLFPFCGVEPSELGHNPEAKYSKGQSVSSREVRFASAAIPNTYMNSINPGSITTNRGSLSYVVRRRRIFSPKSAHAGLVAPATFHESFTHYRSAVT